MSEKVLLVWDKGTRRAYISSSTKRGSLYQDWGNDVEYTTVLEAFRAARKDSIPVTHRAVAYDGQVGPSIRQN